MDTGVVTKSFALLCLFFLCGTSPSLQTDTHSLYYIYTALSKPVELPGIYEFTAMGLLDDRQIDYYNSKEKRKIPTQHWMKEKMQEDYWEKGTQSRKSKEQWFNVNVKILMERMRHNDSDVHVLQWRHGCEIYQEGIETKFSKGIDEYSYDGDNFLSFDDKESQWVAPVDAAVQTKRKWDNVPILNQYTKGYLEKECVDWLNKFREYGDEELRKGSPPDVHVFAKKCTSDKTKVKLTCMASGFYPKDVTLTIRKYRSSLPINEIESSGTRPNHDGTFQLKKSVYIKEDEKAEYDCFVSHKTLTEPIIVTWDGKCKDCNEGPAMAIGIGIGAALVALVACVAGLGFYLYKSKRLGSKEKPRKDEENSFLPGQKSASNVTKSQEECINFDKAGSVSTDSGKESASNISGSDRSLEQGHNSGEGHSQTGSEISSSTDSGEGSAGAKESSVTNSQEEVNNGDSSGKSKAETQSLLPQNNP